MSSRKGFVYDTTSRADPGDVSPEASDYVDVEDVGVLENGTFQANITGLTAETTYYYRAFTYDEAEYKYGAEVSFTTLGSIDGGQYSKQGYRLYCADLDGTQYCAHTGSITGVQSLLFFHKNITNNRGLITLTASASVSVNASGVITTTGLTGASVTTTDLSDDWKVTYIAFDSITVNTLEFGRVASSYAIGLYDEFMLFDSALTADERQWIVDKKLYSGQALYDKVLLWWSFDNPVAGDFREKIFPV